MDIEKEIALRTAQAMLSADWSKSGIPSKSKAIADFEKLYKDLLRTLQNDPRLKT